MLDVNFLKSLANMPPVKPTKCKSTSRLEKQLFLPVILVLSFILFFPPKYKYHTNCPHLQKISVVFICPITGSLWKFCLVIITLGEYSAFHQTQRKIIILYESKHFQSLLLLMTLLSYRPLYGPLMREQVHKTMMLWKNTKRNSAFRKPLSPSRNPPMLNTFGL